MEDRKQGHERNYPHDRGVYIDASRGPMSRRQEGHPEVMLSCRPWSCGILLRWRHHQYLGYLRLGTGRPSWRGQVLCSRYPAVREGWLAAAFFFQRARPRERHPVSHGSCVRRSRHRRRRDRDRDNRGRRPIRPRPLLVTFRNPADKDCLRPVTVRSHPLCRRRLDSSRSQTVVMSATPPPPHLYPLQVPTVQPT
jgi:hypothetical protein